jgi:hypothetical protein
VARVNDQQGLPIGQQGSSVVGQPSVWKIESSESGSPQLVAPTGSIISLTDLMEMLAGQIIYPISPSVVQRPLRVVLWRPQWTPCFALVQRQRGGRIYVKPDKGYGASFSEEELCNRMFEIDAFPLVTFRWILEQTKPKELSTEEP